MTKPVYQAINHHQSVIIFVPSKKLSQSIAIDLVTLASAEQKQERFLHIQPFIEQIENQILKQTISYGIAFLHEGLNPNDRSIIEQLFRSNALQICLISHEILYTLTIHSHLVIIMDTQYYHGKYDDYPINDIFQMISRSNIPSMDKNPKVILMCLSTKKDFYKKFLYELLPIESYLDRNLHDHFNSEIVSKTIENKHDAIDYLTWTLFYRRISLNPNYYNLRDISHRNISEYLSELVENTLNNLQQSTVNKNKSKIFSSFEYFSVFQLKMKMMFHH